MRYAHVENGIIDHRGSLPANWRNISGLYLSLGKSAFLKPLGWLPLIENGVNLGPNETSDGEDVAIGADSVTVTELKRAMTAQEISDRDSGAALSEILRLEEVETPRRLAEALSDDCGGTAEGRSWFKANREKIAVERAKLA
jgi:hypothetical protein